MEENTENSQYSIQEKGTPELSNFPKILRSLPEKNSMEKTTESVLIPSIISSVMNVQ